MYKIAVLSVYRRVKGGMAHPKSTYEKREILCSVTLPMCQSSTLSLNISCPVLLMSHF